MVIYLQEVFFMARKPFTTTLDEDIMYEASMQASKRKNESQ